MISYPSGPLNVSDITDAYRVAFADELLAMCKLCEENDQKAADAVLKDGRVLVPYYVFTNMLILTTEGCRARLGLPSLIYGSKK